MNSMKRSLDIGCGLNPRNPFEADEVYGIDIRTSDNPRVSVADLNIEKIPFEVEFFDYVTAFDFIEHVPRILYSPNRRFPFIELMNEIHRVLRRGGYFFSYTPAFPNSPAWRDPTHVNIITDETLPMYFCEPKLLGKMYGFDGKFQLERQEWHENKIHLISVLKKL